MNMEAMKIISGGQTGVDQGALDFALEHGWPCGGWCPPGRKNEAGMILSRYPVQEVEGEDYHERTRKNVREADATLIITWNGLLETGTALTMAECRETGKHHLHVNFEIHPAHRYKQADQFRNTGKVRDWLVKQEPATLNIAGNRESNSPGIQKFTSEFLELIFYGDM